MNEDSGNQWPVFAKWENSSQSIWAENKQGSMWSIFHYTSGFVQSADAISSTLFWSIWEDLPFKDRFNLHQRSYTLKQLNLLQHLQPKQRTSVFQGTTSAQILAFPGHPVRDWGFTAARLREFPPAPPSVPAEVCKPGYPSIPASSTPNVFCAEKVISQLLQLHSGSLWIFYL